MTSEAWPEDVIFSQEIWNRLSALPQNVAETWEGERRTTSVRLQGQQADAILWVQQADTEIVAFMEAPQDGQDPSLILDCLFGAMLEPEIGNPRRPGKVQINEPGWADGMKPYLQRLRIQIDCCPVLLATDAAFARCKFVNRDHVYPN